MKRSFFAWWFVLLHACSVFQTRSSIADAAPTPTPSNLPSLEPSSSHEPSSSQTPSISQVPSLHPTLSSVPTETPLGQYPNCGTSVRRAWRDLTCEQQQAYLDAVNALKDEGTYDSFVQVHYANRFQTHGGPRFFPWHRWFLWKFEQGLQDVTQSCVTVPFWDWETDSGAEETTSVLDANSFGSFFGTSQGPTCGNGICEEGEDCKSCKDDCLKVKVNKEQTCCTGGPEGTCGDTRCFGENKKKVQVTCSADLMHDEECVNEGQFQWSSTVAGESGEMPDWMCLKREFVPGSDFVHEAGLLWRTTQPTRYAAWGPSIEGAPHAIPHNFIGAHMRTHFSPDDPLFYLHHANVDRLWALWQAFHGQDLIQDMADYDADVHSCCGIMDSELPFWPQEGRFFDDPRFFLDGEQRTPTTREVTKNYQGDAVNVQYDNDRLASLLVAPLGLSQLSGGEWITLWRGDMGCGVSDSPPTTRRRELTSSKSAERLMTAIAGAQSSKGESKLRGLTAESKQSSADKNVNLRIANDAAENKRGLKKGPDAAKLSTFKSTLKELSKLECESVPQIVTPEWMAMNGFSSCTQIYQCFYEDFVCSYEDSSS